MHDDEADSLTVKIHLYYVYISSIVTTKLNREILIRIMTQIHILCKSNFSEK